MVARMSFVRPTNLIESVGQTPPQLWQSVQSLIDAIAARINRSKYISPDYQHVDGTSFASPIIASVAAQMLEANPLLTPADLRLGLTSTAVPLAGVEPARQGAGMVRARRAVEWAIERRGSGVPSKSA